MISIQALSSAMSSSKAYQETACSRYQNNIRCFELGEVRFFGTSFHGELIKFTTLTDKYMTRANISEMRFNEDGPWRRLRFVIEIPFGHTS
jgi:hypothetical protein